MGTSPRVFLDGFNLALTQGTGVATYARNLSFVMGRLGFDVGVLYGTRAASAKNPMLREVGFFDDPERDPPGWLVALRRARRLVRAPLGEQAVRVPITGQVIATTFRDRLPHFDEIWNSEEIFQQAQVHVRLFGTRLDVSVPTPPRLMHWTYPLPLRLRGASNIYTFHDLVPLRLPYTTLDHKRHYLKLTTMLAQQADHIVTVSEASKRDIVSLLGVPEERVTNTYQAVTIPKQFIETPYDAVVREVAGSFGLTAGQYWLFFGAIEPKKNIGRMIEAFLASGVDGPLVLVGKQAWKSEQELRLMFDYRTRMLLGDGYALRSQRKVMLIDYAPFRLLVKLIRGARGVLFPSLYEGFGLPAVEAMLLGTPVITSNTASMPEVVGNAAITVDPYDVAGLAEAIRAVDSDPELRARLADAGPRQAEAFSLERYAERLARLYARLGVPAAAAPAALAPAAMAAN